MCVCVCVRERQRQTDRGEQVHRWTKWRVGGDGDRPVCLTFHHFHQPL